MLFTERFKEAVKTCGLTQRELAEKLNIKESNISNWKKGKYFPSIDVLYKLCIVMGESADYLLGITDEMDIRKD